MALSYGGITLTLSTQELDDLQSAYMRRDQVAEFEGLFAPPYNLGHLPFQYTEQPKLKDLGRLYWPRGASRFAFAHFVISDRILQLIRPLAYNGGTLNPLTLSMSDGTRSTSADLYMLPPRPISQIANPGVPGGSLWGITLVDDRYFWWFRKGEIAVDEGTTTWDDLYDAIASALNISLTIDTVDADYQMPTRRFDTLDQPLPVLLDAVAYSVGQQIVVGMDGSISTQNYDTAKADFDANWEEITNRSFGGLFHTASGTVSGDTFALVPQEVRVVFPVQYIESGEVDTVYPIDNTLSGLALSDYPPEVTGFIGTQVLWGDQYAMVSTGGGTPTNASELDAYAAAMSRDWYLWQLGGTDVVYAGIGPWTPEGISDSVEYLYDAEKMLTRVQRAPWNDRAGGGLLKELGIDGGGGGLRTVYGQAEGAPVLPGYGPRKTLNFSAYHHYVGDNLTVTISDDPGNNRLNWEITNLGVFGQANSGGIEGPEVIVNIIRAEPVIGNNLTIELVDSPLASSLDWTIDNLGIWGRANSVPMPYTFSTLTSTPPSSGQLRTNDATASLTTQLFMAKLNNQGNNNDLVGALRNNAVINVADAANPAAFGQFTIRSTQDSGSFYTIDVDYDSGSLQPDATDIIIQLPIDESGTFGPRRRVNIVSFGGILADAFDNPDEDEIIFTIGIDYPSFDPSQLTKGPDYAVLGYDTTDPIRFRDDPQVVSLIAREALGVGVPSSIVGGLTFWNATNDLEFQIAAPGITEGQRLNLPGLQPTSERQFLMIDQLPGGGIFNSIWKGLYAKTLTYATQVLNLAGLENWRHIFFADDLFSIRTDDSEGYNAPFIDLKAGVDDGIIYQFTGQARPHWASLIAGGGISITPVANTSVTIAVGATPPEDAIEIDVVTKVCPGTTEPVWIPPFSAESDDVTSGNILVADGSAYVAAQMSGDAQMDETGKVSLTTSAMVLTQAFN